MAGAGRCAARSCGSRSGCDCDCHSLSSCHSTRTSDVYMHRVACYNLPCGTVRLAHSPALVVCPDVYIQLELELRLHLQCTYSPSRHQPHGWCYVSPTSFDGQVMNSTLPKPQTSSR